MELNSELPKKSFLKNFLISFCFLSIGLGIVAFLLFNGVKLMIKGNPYRSVLHISMPFAGYNFIEIDRQPLPYLVTITLISSTISAFWATFIAPKHEKNIKWHILFIPWICVIFISPIWGVIWSIGLRSPQYFLEKYSNDPTAVMWLFYKTDAISGLTTGWLSALQSFPINILSYISFCFLLFVNIKLISNFSVSRIPEKLSESENQ